MLIRVAHVLINICEGRQLNDSYINPFTPILVKTDFNDNVLMSKPFYGSKFTGILVKSFLNSNGTI